MTQKNAQIIFIIFNVLAVFAVAYVIDDYVSVINALKSNVKEIPFDSGVYYFLLMSVFWIFSIIQYVGLKNKESKILKYASQISIVWFVLILFLASVIPYFLSNKIEMAGYSKCDDPREVSRIAKGESSFYKIGECN